MQLFGKKQFTYADIGRILEVPLLLRRRGILEALPGLGA